VLVDQSKDTLRVVLQGRAAAPARFRLT
jgi:hypothetical protein